MTDRPLPAILATTGPVHAHFVALSLLLALAAAAASEPLCSDRAGSHRAERCRASTASAAAAAEEFGEDAGWSSLLQIERAKAVPSDARRPEHPSGASAVAAGAHGGGAASSAEAAPSDAAARPEDPSTAAATPLGGGGVGSAPEASLAEPMLSPRPLADDDTAAGPLGGQGGAAVDAAAPGLLQPTAPTASAATEANQAFDAAVALGLRGGPHWAPAATALLSLRTLGGRLSPGEGASLSPTVMLGVVGCVMLVFLLGLCLSGPCDRRSPDDPPDGRFHQSGHRSGHSGRHMDTAAAALSLPPSSVVTSMGGLAAGPGGPFDTGAGADAGGDVPQTRRFSTNRRQNACC
mmetsp:Transcript_16382/g.52511  ORF Transcript_16382/g.52511 Transcript_16382/m.52511 type:complete len:350 (-) Transcript_16382:63-1112(-)